MANRADGTRKDGGYSKDNKQNKISHENIIVPIGRLWPTKLSLEKIVQW